MNEKQKLAAERNWRMLQIKGAIGNLWHLGYQLGMRIDYEYLINLETRMLSASENRWAIEKQRLVAEEAKKIDKKSEKCETTQTPPISGDNI